MTTDEAIGDIKFMASTCGLKFPNQEDRLWKAAEMAISALKEKQEREPLNCARYEACEFNSFGVCRCPDGWACPHGIRSET